MASSLIRLEGTWFVLAAHPYFLPRGQRGQTLQAAWTRHPERFVRGIPKPDPLPEAVWINPPVTSTTGDTAQ